MPADRDKSQKFIFLYSNFYKTYLDEKNGGTPSLQAAPSSGSSGPTTPAGRASGGVKKPAAPTKLGVTIRNAQNVRNQGVVLKTEDLRNPKGPKVEVKKYHPVELTQKRLEDRQNLKKLAIAQTFQKHSVPVQAKQAQVPNHPLESLKQNLEKLKELHERLRFMLQELEELTQD